MKKPLAKKLELRLETLELIKLVKATGCGGASHCGNPCFDP